MRKGTTLSQAAYSKQDAACIKDRRVAKEGLLEGFRGVDSVCFGQT